VINAAALADGFRFGPTVDPIALTAATDLGAGYFMYKSQWTDQSGNAAVDDQTGAATPLLLRFVNDPAAPTVANVNVPVSIISTTYPAFTSTVSDDVEDIGQNHAVFYPVIGFLRYPRTNANLTFDDLISAPTVITTVSPFPAIGPTFARRIEIVDGTSAVQAAAVTDPTAKPTSVQTVVFDVFGQTATSPSTVIPAPVVQNGVSFAAFNAANPTLSVVTWKIANLAAGFLAPAGLKAQVTAPLNSINAPFARVDFYVVGPGTDYWYLGSTGTAINADNGVNRFWTYVAPATLVNSPLTLTAQATPAAGTTVLAIGVSAVGDGISTLATVLLP
jgi:hypothetical protein